MSSQEVRILIIMPVHNEAAHLRSCLESFVGQSRPPDILNLVDDHSTDDTAEIVREYTSKHPWIRLKTRKSSPRRRPVSKVVEAFMAGLPEDWERFDYIGKFDGDIILPPDYFEKILESYASAPNLGMCSGLLYIEKKGDWTYEPIADKSHIRGPVKFYSRECYKAISGLRPSIGWDVADVLLARFYGFQIKTRPDLIVKHLRPTGSGYSAHNARLQGMALYNLRYGWFLSGIAVAKMALTRKKLFLPWHAGVAYIKAYVSGKSRMLTREQGRFARKWRWKGIYNRLFKGL
ncbi:MAG: glycosyltransferase family 2 protein [Robiginitalea sp.]